MRRINPASLIGQTESHLCSSTDAERLGTRIHRDVVQPFLLLQDDARAAGFDLRIFSGFRDLDRQSSIWNRKATGKLAVLDSHAAPLNIERLTEHKLVYAILRWSALPGASRHHWGTDIDVYDENTRPGAYEIELIPSEVEAGGIFAPLHRWLDEKIAAGTAHGFFRPYDEDRQGVAPERWHLSYAPVATPCAEGLTIDILGASISASELELKGTVLEHLKDIYKRFVININRDHS